MDELNKEKDKAAESYNKERKTFLDKGNRER